MRAYVGVLSVVLCAVSAACSDDATPSTAVVGSGGSSSSDNDSGSDESGGSGGTAPSACNDLELDAPAVGFTMNRDAQPEAEGGTLVDGKYFLTAEILYDTSSGFPTDPIGRSRVEIDGSSWNEVSGDPEPDGVNPDQRSTRTIALSGKTLTLTASCPTGGPDRKIEYTYTAKDDALTIYVEDSGKTVGTVFTKQ